MEPVLFVLSLAFVAVAVVLAIRTSEVRSEIREALIAVVSGRGRYDEPPRREAAKLRVAIATRHPWIIGKRLRGEVELALAEVEIDK